jgi:hypothetical protein
MNTDPRMEKSVDSADLKSAAETHDGSSPSSGTKNPNNCSTCVHKKDPDGGWCYMFRNEPTDVCNLHSEKHKMFAIGDIADIDLRTAELVVTAFRQKYPELAEYQKELLSRIEKDPNLVFKAQPYRREIDLKAFLFPTEYETRAMHRQSTLRDKVRQSTKTGATWPKPKGSY